MNNANKLLAQAKALWFQAQANYRDARLQIGRTLHEFVLAHLRQGIGLSFEMRCRQGFTRRRAREILQQELEATDKQINDTIITAMAADLLSDRGHVGNLGHRAIRQFTYFIRRQTGTRTDNMKPGRDWTTSELWQIRTGFEAKAKALFRQAVAETWSQTRCLEEVLAVFRNQDRPRQSLASQSRRARLSLSEEDSTHLDWPKWKQSVRHAAPDDVAEMCLELIEAAEDPAAVALRLRILLERFLPKKKAVV
jgi:hypothetical protein